MAEKQESLRSQARNLPYSKVPFKMDEWLKSTPDQREQWKQDAIEADAKVKEVRKLIREQFDIILGALKTIYGDATNYKGKPIGSDSITYHRLSKYLGKDKNSPFFGLQSANHYVNLWNDKNAEYEKAKEASRELELAIEREKAWKAKEVEKIRIMTEICIRHDIDTSLVPDAYEIQEKLESKDKYLALAMGGMRTRGDWSDGYHYAETAFSNFEVENDTDKAIVEDWQEIFTNGDMDGRYFRDTKWNYNAIFELVGNKQLINDCMKLEEYIT